MQDAENTTLPALRQQLADTEKGIENMLNAIQMGVLTFSTKERLEMLEKQRDELKISILTEKLQKLRLSKESIIAWIDQFRCGDRDSVEYRKRVIDCFVNAVHVFDGRLVLTYNFHSGTQTVPLKGIEAVYGSDLVEKCPVRPYRRHDKA